MELTNKRGFTSNGLKIIAIIAMTFDHVAMEFIPYSSVVGQLFRVIGRLTIAIMCYMVTEGFFHTRDLKKYMIRMFIFALISHVPYVFLHTGKISFLMDGAFGTSVMWPLFLGLVSLWVWNHQNIHKAFKIIILILLCLLANEGDWGPLAVIWIWGFGLFHKNTKKQMIFFGAIAFAMALSAALMWEFTTEYPWYREVFQFGLLCAIPILMKYNEERGKSKNIKWLFYIYYPLHMIILGIIALIVK